MVDLKAGKFHLALSLEEGDREKLLEVDYSEIGENRAQEIAQHWCCYVIAQW